MAEEIMKITMMYNFCYVVSVTIDAMPEALNNANCM
jgi:hypothetical protein